MRKTTVSVAVLGVAAAIALAGCSSSGNKTSTTTTPNNTTTPAGGNSSTPSSGAIDGKGAKVGIILPDTTSSPRWVSSDPVALKADCTKYNLTCDIQNADGSAAKMKTIAQQMEADGIKVLMIVDLDQASGAAIEQQAKAAGVATVDYDRLTPGGG